MHPQLFRIPITGDSLARLVITATECNYEAPSFNALAPYAPSTFDVCSECVGYGENPEGLRGIHYKAVTTLRHIALSASQCCLCGEGAK